MSKRHIAQMQLLDLEIEALQDKMRKARAHARRLKRQQMSLQTEAAILRIMKPDVLRLTGQVDEILAKGLPHRIRDDYSEDTHRIVAHLFHITFQSVACQDHFELIWD